MMSEFPHGGLVASVRVSPITAVFTSKSALR